LEWAIGVAEHSAIQIIEGLGSHYSEDMEQVELIRLVRAKLQAKGTITKGLLFKICENKTNDQRKIWGFPLAFGWATDSGVRDLYCLAGRQRSKNNNRVYSWVEVWAGF